MKTFLDSNNDACINSQIQPKCTNWTDQALASRVSHVLVRPTIIGRVIIWSSS